MRAAITSPIRRLTVAICTWNRHQLLRQTLEGMTSLLVPPGLEWEVLVINNNSTDATDQVIESFADRLPVRRVFEAQPGLSCARNRAVHEATGEYIIWTDDDVLVAPDWMVEYHRAFERWPSAVVFGGPIQPWFPNAPPSWLAAAWPQVANAYACIDYGRDAVPLTPSRVPFGASFAIQTARQRTLLYDIGRGVRPGSRVGGEETDVVRRALEAGDAGWWVPTARVRHYIPAERQTIHYLRRWYSGYGEYLGRFDRSTGFVRLFGVPRWVLRQALFGEMRYCVRRWTSDSPIWMEDLKAASTAWGQMRGYRMGAR